MNIIARRRNERFLSETAISAGNQQNNFFKSARHWGSSLQNVLQRKKKNLKPVAG
jgi:hypothetical protein